MSKGTIVIAGGSGFLGRRLVDWFERCGYRSVVLSRNPYDVGVARVVLWDGRTLGEWADSLDGASALVNLTGRSVDCRYNAANREAIMRSRVESTRVLGEAVARCAQPPGVWLNSSTATIYQHTYGEAHDENGPTVATAEAKDAFSVEVAKAWEAAFAEAAAPGIRQVVMRTAIALGREGRAYRMLMRLARWWLGGPMAGGRQWVSWLHQQDFCRAVQWLIENPEASGVYNLAAPNAVTNGELMELLREVNGRRFGLPAPRWLLELGAMVLRTETELIIKSRHVAPARLLREGFEFRYETLEEALLELASH